MNWHPSFFVNCWPSILGPQIHMAACIWNLWLQYSVLDCLHIYWSPGHIRVEAGGQLVVLLGGGLARVYAGIFHTPRLSYRGQIWKAPYWSAPGRRGGGHQLWKGGCLPCLSASQHLIGQYKPEEGWGVAVLCCASALSSMHPDKMHPVVQLRMQPCDDFAKLKRLHRHTGAIIIWGLYTLFIYKCDAWGQWKTSSSAISVYVPEGLALFD